MKPLIPYRLLIALLLMAGAMAGCGSRAKTLNKRVTLWRNDKIPYGTWYAYNNLQTIFPKASVVISKRSPDRYKPYTLQTTREDYSSDDNSQRSSYIIISNKVLPDDNEVAAILGMVSRGQNVFISSLRIGENLLDSLRLKTAYYTSYYNVRDSLTVSVNDPESNDSLSYSYPGMAMDNYFVSLDTSITAILGKDKYGRANFVRFNYEGGGSLFIHLAPMALTNFFLLHKENKSYYDNVLSYLPQNTEEIRWDEYFRYHEGGSENQSGQNGKGLFGAFSWIMQQPPLAIALWLLLILLLIIYLFESKRKQRIIPEIQPLKNASLDFVKTIGRLYFQRRNNKNLAQKMMVHFQDHVRIKYGIRNALNDPAFEQRLVWKTGYKATNIRSIVHQMNRLQEMEDVSDESLLLLNRKLEHFYKYA